MAWVLLTGAGLVAETAVIVFLGRQATARSDAGVLVGPAPSPVHPSEDVHPSPNRLS